MTITTNEKQALNIGESKRKQAELETKTNAYKSQIDELKYEIKKLGEVLNHKIE